jgi:ribosomal protein S18 acetylase RimI-like enzyme
VEDRPSRNFPYSELVGTGTVYQVARWNFLQRRFGKSRSPVYLLHSMPSALRRSSTSVITLLLLSSAAAWQIQPASLTQLRKCASLCIDEFEQLQMPLLAFPGWEERAREEAIGGWASSREALLSGSEAHALLVAIRDEMDAGRYFEGVDDGLLGFAEMGLLPAPPEQGGPSSSGSLDASPPPPLPQAGAGAPPLYPYVANLAVKKGARRLGLGRELVLATERAAASCGYNRMYIKVDRQNFDARRLYDKLGYRLVYLQPRTDPRKGPLGANLFLRKDGGLGEEHGEEHGEEEALPEGGA